MLEAGLRPERTERIMVHRGMRAGESSMTLDAYVQERSDAQGDGGAEEVADGGPSPLAARAFA